ncbi:MAG: hypothetical protein ACOZQL_19535 [Myxococcota bacterium]
MHLRWVLLALMALSGCKSQKLRDVEAELAATRSRLATLETKRKELLAESKRLLVERKTHAQQADEAELARNQVLAAGLVLGGQPVPDGVLLDDALRSKRGDLGRLAATIVQRQLPCGSDTPADEPQEGSPCEPPPLEDACEGVEPRIVQPLSWTCAETVASPGLATVAVCKSAGAWTASTLPLAVPGERVDADVVRLAFEHHGRLVVADWPPPDLELYRPRNASELDACEATNSQEQCLRTCDERFGRLSGCGDGWGDSPMGEEDEENEEPYELRQAREAAALAEAQAAEARNELEYQECRAPCEVEATEEGGALSSVSLTLRKERFPGLFFFDVTIDGHDDAGVSTRQLVLSFDELLEAKRDALELPAEDLVRGLSVVFDTPHLEQLESKDEVTYVGFDVPTNTVRAVTFSKAADGETRWLNRTETCQLVAERKLAQLEQYCPAARPPAVEAAFDGGADAGEVTP